MTSPTLLVLAAGMGTRYGGLKQIDPIGPGGETFIDYSIYDALRAGFRKAVFVIRKDIEQPFRRIVGRRFENRMTVEYVFQGLDSLPSGFQVPAGRTKPWGTTHAVLMAANAIHEPFAAINADDFYGAEGFRVLACHLQSESADSAMVGFVLRNTLSEFGTVARGECRVSDTGYLEGVVELTGIERDGAHARNTDAAGHVTRLTGDEIVSMNMWGFQSGIFEDLRESFLRFLKVSGSDLRSECYLPGTVNELITAGRTRVRVLCTHDRWFGMTYQGDHLRAVETINHLIQHADYPERLWA